MEVAETLLNRSEAIVFRELESIAKDNKMLVFPKTRLSDVIVKGSSYLTQREFDFYTRAHCDFVLTDPACKPVAIIEYDGPLHDDPKQQERDAIKDELCRKASMGLLRINAKHVTRYRGMSVLRWIVEISELQKGFLEAQESGQIPWDEPFDPCFVDSFGDGKRFPYWLSAPATQSFHAYFETLDPSMPKGWSSSTGRGPDGIHHRLSCLFFDQKILWTKTAIREQDFDFPHYDLLDEITTCQLGMKLKAFREGRLAAHSKGEFAPVFKDFAAKYDAHPSHSMGSFPIPCKFDFKKGYVFRD